MLMVPVSTVRYFPMKEAVRASWSLFTELIAKLAPMPTLVPGAAEFAAAAAFATTEGAAAGALSIMTTSMVTLAFSSMPS